MTRFYELTTEDILALRSYADEFGQHWKEMLADDWFHARTRTDYGRDRDKRIAGRGNILHNLRNQLGPTWLDKLRLNRLMTADELHAAKLAYFDTLPRWQRHDPDAPAMNDIPRWSGKDNPPAIGETVTTRVYNKDGFKAVVTGFFTQSGCLGVTADLLDPPDKFIEREEGDPRVHLFGAELEGD